MDLDVGDLALLCQQRHALRLEQTWIIEICLNNIAMYLPYFVICQLTLASRYMMLPSGTMCLKLTYRHLKSYTEHPLIILRSLGSTDLDTSSASRAAMPILRPRKHSPSETAWETHLCPAETNNESSTCWPRCRALC